MSNGSALKNHIAVTTINPKQLTIDGKSLQKHYKSGDSTIKALDNVDISIPTGQFACIMGRSGSGKSTLLNIFGAIDRVDAGTVLIEGQDLRLLNDSALSAFRRKKIGFIFQSFNLMPTLTTVENVALPLLLDGVSTREATDRALELLAKVQLEGRSHHRPDQLSGGQMQRVAIARALIARPALLLADEPTGNLDSAIGKQILTLLKDLSEKENQTIVLVTHDNSAAKYANRLIVMKDGSVASDERT